VVLLALSSYFVLIEERPGCLSRWRLRRHLLLSLLPNVSRTNTYVVDVPHFYFYSRTIHGMKGTNLSRPIQVGQTDAGQPGLRAI
jgi:hypothetical protein